MANVRAYNVQEAPAPPKKIPPLHGLALSSQKEKITKNQPSTSTHPTHPPYDGTFGKCQNHLYLPPLLDKLLVGRVGGNSAILDQYRWIISSIHYQRCINKHFDPDSYIPLNFEVLRSILSKRKVTKFIGDLCRWCIIEQDRTWVPGQRSIGYRLASEFRGLKVKARPLTNRAMIKRLARFRHSNTVLKKATGRGYAMVHQSLQSLRIDEKRAMRFIRYHHSTDSDSYNSRLISINLIATRSYFFIIDGKAGRAHHNLTNLAADLRPFLTINGQPLSQVDISNSQPLFLHLTLSRAGRIDTEESDRMWDLVRSGQFYDALKPEGQNRDQFKIEIFRDVLFGTGKYTTTTTEHFRLLFPTYAEEISHLKKPDYTNLAITLQATEAEVIFDAVERFGAMTEYQVPILTIHDSLVTTSDHIEEALYALNQACQELHGIIPPTKTK
jgi:hypothetical protein